MLWVYKTIYDKLDMMTEERLDEIGMDGWELFSIIKRDGLKDKYIFFLKKQKSGMEYNN